MCLFPVSCFFFVGNVDSGVHIVRRICTFSLEGLSPRSSVSI